MPFEILNLTAATMVSLTSRTERHGKEDVSAMSFRLRFSGPNTMLDMLSADVRKTLYMAAEGQEDLPGVEPITPLLRCKAVKTWVPEITYEGWTVTVDYGIDETSQIVMGGCKVDAFTAELFDGGTVAIECRVSTCDLDWMGAGRLWSLQKRELQVMLAAPLTTQTNPEAGEQDDRQLTLDAHGNEVREPSDARQAAEDAFRTRVTNCPTCGPSEFEREEGTATCLGCGWTTRESGPDGETDGEGSDTDATDAFVAQHAG